MQKPEYPTKEGIWSNGKRNEETYSQTQLKLPYTKAVKNFRQAITDRKDFDPAVLFVWGTMQATGVLNILKAIEEKFGKEGQKTVRKAINDAGYEAAKDMMENSSFPDNLDETEMISFMLTGVNTILYASLEKPWITSKDKCEFDILWCPHQDRYSAFDCRVQRFFVEGMINAFEDLGQGKWTGAVEKLIPLGADRCHFVIDRMEKETEKNPWHQYSDELGNRAFQKLQAEKT